MKKVHQIKISEKVVIVSYEGKNLCKKCFWNCDETKRFFPMKVIQCTNYNYTLFYSGGDYDKIQLHWLLKNLGRGVL